MVGVVGECELAMRQAAAARPDVVLVDWRLGDEASRQMVADLMSGDDPTPVIILSTTQDRPKAKRSGAAAYATLGDPPDDARHRRQIARPLHQQHHQRVAVGEHVLRLTDRLAD